MHEHVMSVQGMGTNCNYLLWPFKEIAVYVATNYGTKLVTNYLNFIKL